MSKQRQTFKPRTWSDVKAGDIVAYRRGKVVKRMRIARDPHAFQDAHARGYQMCGIQGAMVNKDGSRSKVQPRFGAYRTLLFSEVVEVTGHRDWVTDVEQAHAEALDYVAAAATAVEVHDAAFGPAAEAPTGAETQQSGLMSDAKVEAYAKRHRVDAASMKAARDAVKAEIETEHANLLESAHTEAPGEDELPDGAITNGVGGTCRRMDGEHSTHGYARYGMECVPAALVSADLLIEQAAKAPAHVRNDCPALPVGGCVRCTAPATAARSSVQPIKDVHTGHCCKRHGCKYSFGLPEREAECTVVSGQAPQEHPCEQCGEPDPAAALEELAKLRKEVFGMEVLGYHQREDIRGHLDRIEAALRGKA